MHFAKPHESNNNIADLWKKHYIGSVMNLTAYLLCKTHKKTRMHIENATATWVHECKT